MSTRKTSRYRTLARRGAGIVGAGALVAMLNISGVGAPGPAHTALNAPDRHDTVSRSLPDRLDAQSGVTAPGGDTPFLRLATGRAEAPEQKSPDAAVCISSPLAPGVFRISSSYGMRTNPVSGGYGLHAGVDLAAPMATPIHAVADGVVSYAGQGRAGRSSELVIIDHEIDGREFSSWYVHMYPHGVHVSAGQEVRAGEVIAEVGSNGFSTGPHLHLEIHTPLAGPSASGMATGSLAGRSPAAREELGELAVTSGEEDPSPQEPEPGSGDPGDPEPDEKESEDPEDPDPEEPGSEDDEQEGDGGLDPDRSGSEAESGEDDEGLEADEGEGSEAPEAEEFEIEEDDDGGQNDHTIEDTVSRDSGIFDPSSLGVLHDPLPFLRALGYGLAAPSSCWGA